MARIFRHKLKRHPALLRSYAKTRGRQAEQLSEFKHKATPNQNNLIRRLYGSNDYNLRNQTAQEKHESFLRVISHFAKF